MVGGRNESIGEAGTSPSKIIQYIRRSLARLSPTSFACLVLAYLTTLHAIGLYHFTRGFLLTRLTLDTRAPSYAEDDPVHGLARWDKAIVLVIDALRTDFLITPHDRVDEYYHDVLTLPAQLTAQDPTRSVLYNAYSDPPTTTMQRIKGFTTGSLPTFIDAGANFASSAIEEDSLVHQLHAHGRKLAFMGDETWTLLFPRLFEPGMSHPFDSFNVEDLHTVDTGVIEHLFPYLDRANSSRWDVMIGHFLGVDHVGHRVGPSSSIMTDKLAQMNDVLTRVVDEMDDDTLLVVLGDHGMDSRGDHGGDGTAETASALWMYSKSRPIVPLADRTIKYHTTGLLGDDTQQVRTVNQIDLVPTLALALGVPIPFNNIGKVIPEFFQGADDNDLTLAMARNTEQVKRYLDSYTGQLDRRALNESYAAITTTASPSSDGTGTAQVFLDETLAHLRQLWAQFSVPRISLGLFILFLTLPTTLILYTAVRNTRRAADSAWQPLMREILALTFSLGLVGGCIIGTVRGAYTRVPSEAIAWSVTGAAVVSQVTLLTSLGGRTASSILRSLSASSSSSSSSSRLTTMAGAGILLLHAGSYAANSFIIWEDRATLFLACSLAALPMLKALTAPTPRLRLKIFGFSVATAVIVRLIGMSTVCREEQQPYCTVTFYAHSTQPVAPTSVLALTLPVAWYLPNIIGLFLAQSRALSGPAKPALIPGLRAALTAGAAYWNLEWAETWTGIQPARRPVIAFIKLWLARVLLGVLSGAAPYVWAQLPLCIDVKREVVAEDQAEVLAAPNTAAPPTTEQSEPETRVIVYGFANSYGASYLLFLCIPFAILFLLSQPTAQLVLAAALVGILCHLESVDAQRDAKSMALAFSGSSAPGEFDGAAAAAVDGTTRTLPPRFTELVFLALLAHVLFFSTGHQAVLSTIQWKTAFIGVATVVYPVSPLLVAINTFGPFMLVALAVPLLALWNVSPHPSARTPVIGDTVQAALGFSLYFSTTAFTSALFSAYLRRHLMVWKVFAPRFMMAGVVLLLVDVALVLGVGFGVARVAWTVKRTFKCESV